MAEHIDSPPSSRSHADTDGSTHLMQAEEEIALDALDYHDVVFTDGNAASRDTKF